MVIADVLFQQPSQMSLVEDDHMVEQVPTHTANPALRNSVLPGTAECGPNRLAAHRLHGRDDISTELRVAIEDQEALRLLAVFPSFVSPAAQSKARWDYESRCGEGFDAGHGR